MLYEAAVELMKFPGQFDEAEFEYGAKGAANDIKIDGLLECVIYISERLPQVLQRLQRPLNVEPKRSQEVADVQRSYWLGMYMRIAAEVGNYELEPEEVKNFPEDDTL